MRIDSIALYNFGSYEGESVFDTNSLSGKNIVLIGGKNGAGKTTLFTAMRICLYGYMSMGYKNYNAFYTRAVTKLINNTAKMAKPTSAHVTLNISLSNGREIDHYQLTREWRIEASLTETFSVSRNGVSLSTDEVADFEKYLLSLIPPELFNLYFFDGEKIADFFMTEGSNSRIKDAFLTLCGYDTFDIMRRNFKRIGSSTDSSTPSLDAYLLAKQLTEKAQLDYQILSNDLTVCEDALASCEAELIALEKGYTQKGGITQEEWNDILIQLKEEEKKRDTWNTLLRKWANDLVPFLMVREQLVEVKEQISSENDTQKYRNFCEILESPDIITLLGTRVAEIKRTAFTKYGSEKEQILSLSLEQSTALLSQINAVLSFDVHRIETFKQAIKQSISFSAELRQQLENSSVDSVQAYMQQRSALLEQKNELLHTQVTLEQALFSQKEILQQAEVSLGKAQGKLEEELKKASISDISARAIVMLDKLQHILYRQQINRVEAFFRDEIKTLMRKSNFIDDIKIDDDFNIFLYRNESVPRAILIDALQERSEERVINTFGAAALQELYHLAGNNTIEAVAKYCASLEYTDIVLPIRVDQAAMSNGEKQIFIMALYHSLVQLGRHRVPFIIDTPFARIDTEHRRNISQHFFSKLHGQVFILSTNEEISSSDIQLMKEKIAATYTLENSDNKRTVLVQNSYFEV